MKNPWLEYLILSCGLIAIGCLLYFLGLPESAEVIPPLDGQIVIEDVSFENVEHVYHAGRPAIPRKLEYTGASEAQADGMALAAELWFGATSTGMERLPDGRFRVWAIVP